MGPGLMNAAMAWRVKYRLKDEDGKTIKTHSLFQTLGCHQKNRGGLYPSGIRCKNLCVEVLEAGFVKEEVTHQLVAVEEYPVDFIKQEAKD